METDNRKFDGYYVIVPVWGKEYVRLFLDYGLPTHLSPRNMPAIASLGCRYHILTHAEDIPVIEASSAIAVLRSYAEVIIEAFTDAQVFAGRSDIPQGYNRSLNRQTWCYQQGLNRSRHLNVAYLFLTPDCLWSDGCFYYAEEARQRGKRAVMITGLRLNKANAMEAVEAYRNPGEANRDVLLIPPRNLVALTLRHLQPTIVSMMMNIGIGHRSQNYHLWCVPGEGVLLRGFHPHPIMAWPTNKNSVIDVTVDCRYAQLACPREAIEMIADSDRGFCVDLANLYHTTHFVTRREKTLDQDLEFMINCTDDFHRWAARQDVVLKTCEITPGKWAGPRAEAKEFIDGLLAEYSTRIAKNEQPQVSRSPLQAIAKTDQVSSVVPVRSPFVRSLRRALRPLKRIVRGVSRRMARLAYYPVYRQITQMRMEVESLRSAIQAPNPMVHSLQAELADLRNNFRQLLSEGQETGILADITQINALLLYVYWVLNYGYTFEEAARPVKHLERNRVVRLAS